MSPESLDVQLNGPSISAKEISAKFRSGRQDVGRQAAVRPWCTQYSTMYCILSTVLCSSSTSLPGDLAARGVGRTGRQEYSLFQALIMYSLTAVHSE